MLCCADLAFRLLGLVVSATQVFFKCFVMIVLFGQFFGLLVLPVLLSLIGPVKSFASVHGKVEPSKNANFAGLTGI